MLYGSIQFKKGTTYIPCVDKTPKIPKTLFQL